MTRDLMELQQLLSNVEKRFSIKDLNPKSLKKLWNFVKTLDKPNRKMLDKISLLAGFQNWESFDNALHGDSDAQSNYDDDNENLYKNKERS